MAFKHNRLTDWSQVHLPGETVVSHAVTWTGPVAAGQYGSANSHGDRLRLEYAESLGLESIPGPASLKTFCLLTDRQLALATRSNMRDQPKDMPHTAPLNGVRVHWFDHDAGAGNRFRHYITEFGDGTCRADRSALTQLGRTNKSNNADHFIESLGDRAVQLTDL